MKYSLLLLIFAVCATAESVPVSFTVGYPGRDAVEALFGHMPKNVQVTLVTACNDSPETLSLPEARMIALLRAQGFDPLTRIAAVQVVVTSQAQSKRYLTGKYAQVALNIVTGLVVSKAVNVGPVLGPMLPGVMGILQVVVPELRSAVSDHASLSYETAGMPSVSGLSPLGCVAGVMLLNGKDSRLNAAATFNASIPVTGK